MKTKVLEEIKKFIGEAPEMVKLSEIAGKDVCFTCGQPFNKSKQVAELLELIEKSLTKHTEEVLKDLLPQKEEIFELTYEQFCKDKDSFKMLMFEQALKEGKNLCRQQIIDKAKEKYNITIK